LKKLCYKVSLSENCQQQSCKAFTGITIRAKVIGGDVPLNVNFALNKPLHHLLDYSIDLRIYS